ncbi:uncharacterized protein [Mytilus edulis]|uniref:uncharacterized protein n=1 Tax=Mytilus edulis TaxID=6550 RepID=UPI0039EEDD44
MAILLFLISILVYGSLAKNSKRILLTDPDYADNQQLHRDMQNLKALVQQLQGTIQNQAPVGVVYTRWGRKDCAGDNTDLVYTGISGGGHYTETGRAAEPVCLPHDPINGNVLSSDAHASVYGMEYEGSLGGSLHDKDVPCAVCRANHVTSKVMIPGKTTCHVGWRKEYSGMLVAGYHGHISPSSYFCVDQHPDVLEGGLANDNGYVIYPAIAKCGSLKCPPYVPDTRINCVVCTK